MNHKNEFAHIAEVVAPTKKSFSHLRVVAVKPVFAQAVAPARVAAKPASAQADRNIYKLAHTGKGTDRNVYKLADLGNGTDRKVYKL